MTLEDIKKIIATGESETVEFKESFGEEALETIGAFSNASGGIILIGVKDSGDICGLQVGKKTLEDIANRIQNVTDPRLQLSLTTAHYKNNTILIINVPQSSGIPISIRGRFFKRSGRSNQRMSHEEIIQLMSASVGLNWTSLAEPKATLDCLNFNLIKDFIETVKKINRRPLPEKASELEILSKLELIKDNQPTRAAILLFGTEPTTYFPSAFLKIGRFRSPTLIVDDREARGGLFQQLEETMNWFRERLETAFIITGKPQREVHWEYPLEAIREAVINALCHRDYTISAHSQIRLYDDHLSIWNAGGLPISLTTEALFKEHDSISRNPKIAQAFYYTGLIEKWGSGTLRMAEELAKAKLPKPEFTSEAGRFKVVFYRQTKGHDKEPAKQMHQLSLRQENIIELLTKNKQMSSAEIMSNLKVPISERTLQYELVELKKMGLVGSLGAGRATSWMIKK